MSKKFLTASRVGIYAKQALEKISTGKVMGATSKGVFLLFGQYSLFLTLGQGLSPFNITFAETTQLPQGLETGDEVFYAVGDLLIPTRQVTIALGNAEIWTPPQAESANYDPAAHRQALKALLAQIQRHFPSKGFLFLQQEAHELSEEQLKVKLACTEFKNAFEAHDLPGCLEASGSLFGLGGGLTPSGDDWLAGFMLFSARTVQATQDMSFLQMIGTELTRLAYQKTTFVSANRLEAACKGWSEELFLRVVDLQMRADQNSLSTLAEALYGFGHSSGVDTLMGIWIACGLCY